MSDEKYQDDNDRDGSDLEKDTRQLKGHEVDATHFEALDDGIPRNRGFFAKLWALTHKLDKYNVEARGIERVMPDQRGGMHWFECFTFWVSANSTISTLSIGCLGQSIFFLNFKDAVLTIVFFNLLATFPVAYFSTWGARTGLRQMVVARFSFGYYPAWFPGIMNVVATIGWATINCIVGAQTLHAATSSHRIPVWASIVVISLLTLGPAFGGIRFMHAYERYASIVPIVIFFIILGQGSKYFDVGDWGGTGHIEAASVLSFGASVVGYGFGWASIASDYTVSLPENESGAKIFWATYLGLNTPLILIQCLGAAFMTTFSSKPTWEAAYEIDGLGGLIAESLRGSMGGFGSFLTILLSLSIVANNCPNSESTISLAYIYSLSLTIQLFGPWVQAIPRVFIVLVGTGVYVALAIVGSTHFESWLETLLVLLSYWLAIFATISVEEHFIFRKGQWSNYNLNDYGTMSRLPPGFAASLGIGVGIAGAVLGMSQTWYVGPVGLAIAPETGFGGDIGFELAAGFTAVVFPVARYFEKRHFGR